MYSVQSLCEKKLNYESSYKAKQCAGDTTIKRLTVNPIIIITLPSPYKTKTILAKGHGEKSQNALAQID